MLIAVVAARDVAVVTLTWLLGLAHGIGATLDRQVVRWLWLRRRATRLIALGPALPLTAAVLAAAFKMRILRAWLIILWPWRSALRTRLIILGPATFRAAFMLPAAALRPLG